MNFQAEKWIRWGAVTAAAAASLALTGCGLGTMTPTASPVALGVISGNVHGGQQPVGGAQVFLLAAATSGYGSGNNSNSLLSGSGYVTTDAGGNFSISGLYTCPSATSQVYLVAKGGNPGLAAGTNNGALTLAASLGPCGSLGASTRVTINEVSTIAMAYALSGFASNYAQVSSSTTNTAGLANAFASVSNIISIASGGALQTTPAGNGTVSYRKINTLADILAPCVNSNGSDGNCSALFSAATPSGGTAPTDTFGAALAMAQNPGNNVALLYNLVTPSAPFQPAVTTAPTDLTVWVTYTGTGISQPYGLAIDGNNNIWVTNQGSNSITELNNLGAFQQNITSATTNQTSQTPISNPVSVAVDTNNYVYVANSGQNNILRIGGSSVATAYFNGGLSTPAYLGIDGNNTVYIANQGNNSLSMLITQNSNATPAGPYTAGGSISMPSGVAVDGTGQVFISSAGNSSVAKFSPSTLTFYSTSGAMGGGLTAPQGIAFDGTGTAFLPNSTGTVSVFNNSPSATSSSPYNAGGSGAGNGVAIDGLKRIYVTGANGTLKVLSNSGTALSPSGGYAVGAQLNGPAKLGLDISGNAWIANSGSGSTSVTEVIGLGAPTITPIALGVKNGTLGTRP